MNPIWVYDIETFKYDWVIIFMNAKDETIVAAHNNPAKVREFLKDSPTLVGFNNKLFDDYLLKAIVNGASPEMVKSISDFIISGRLPWEHWFIKEMDAVRLNTADVRDDMYIGLSLKAIEGHFFMPIIESSVPFDINRELTKKELNEVLYYCISDVKATLKILRERISYFNTKLRLAKLGNIEPTSAFGMTNAKLTAAYLGARFVPRADGREYTIPDRVNTAILPPELLEFFTLLEDHSLTDDELYKTSITLDIAGVPCVFGWGGVHGSVTQYHSEAKDGMVIGNRDVASLYPSLMIQYDYISRNIESPERFKRTYNRRMEAKAQGHIDGHTLKLPLNTASGAMENKYNDMYDPRQSRGLRITGQLLMTELVLEIANQCKTFNLLNLNTDGFMYEIHESEKPRLDKLCKVWENNKCLELEEIIIKKVWIKDVNNLLFVSDTGQVTTVGGYLNHGVSEKAGWTINNNMTVVDDALIAKMAYDVPIEDTIRNENNPFKFQIIAHAGSKYKSVYQDNVRGRTPLQKTNRVYASKDRSKGTLFKVKHGKQKGEKIASLPLSCLVDNEGTATIDLIDKEWYINLARKRFYDFTGGKTWQTSFLRK